jgi:hypothetical protein
MTPFWLYAFFAAHPLLFALAIFITSAVVGHK